MNFRKPLAEKINDRVLDKIKKAPKPTKVAEVLAVIRQFPGMALTFEEIAELNNISEFGKPEKAKASDYVAALADIRKHPEIRVIITPSETVVRFTGDGTTGINR